MLKIYCPKDNGEQALHEKLGFVATLTEGPHKKIHAYKPVLAFKCPSNSRDYFLCNQRRCSHCINIIKTDVFKSSGTQNSFNLGFHEIVRLRMLSN